VTRCSSSNPSGNAARTHHRRAEGIQSQIAGEDKQCKPATAQIVGDTVIVHSPEIAKLAALR